MDLVHRFTPKVEKILNQNPFDLDKSLLKICKLLKTNIIHFDWVGFYFTNSKKTHLELKSFYGTPTEHKKIPFGKGVCGQVAISNKKLIHAYGPMKKTVVMDINQTIKRIEKTAKLKVIGIKRL